VCQDDFDRIETQHMVLIMTVLSLCTEAECGFQRPVSPEEEKAEDKVAGATAPLTEESFEKALAGTQIGTMIRMLPRDLQLAMAAGALAGPEGVAAAMGVYGIKELIKYSAWNNEAKEKEFKHQFVAHVTKKLRPIVDSTSANCSKQVEQ